MTAVDELFSRAIALRTGINPLFSQGNHLDVVLEAQRVANLTALGAALESGQQVSVDDLIHGNMHEASDVHDISGLRTFIDHRKELASNSSDNLRLDQVYSPEAAERAVALTDKYALGLMAHLRPELANEYKLQAQPLKPQQPKHSPPASRPPVPTMRAPGFGHSTRTGR